MIPEFLGQNSKDTIAFCFCSLGCGRMKSLYLRIRVVEVNRKKCHQGKYSWVFQEANRWFAPQEAQIGTLGFHFYSNLRLFQKSPHPCLFPFLSHLNNPIRKHTSSNDAFKSAAGKTYISSSAERLILCTLIRKILCGFISTNPSLRLYISVIPTSERSSTAGRTAARGGGVYVDNGYRHICTLHFLCEQTGETRT